MTVTAIRAAVLGGAAFWIAGTHPGIAMGAGAQRSYAVTEEREACRDFDPARRPLFGDTHVHTALSFDASTQDTRNTPRDAYRFAKGERIGLQPYDDAGKPTRTIQLERPLDFVAVTDHGELLGEVSLCTDPASPAYDNWMCDLHRGWQGLAFRLWATRTIILRDRFGLCGGDDALCLERSGRVWQTVREAAEEAYDRSAACGFTSFVGYEWTAVAEDGINLHRNVIFRNEKVPVQPISWVDTRNAVELWDELERQCIEGLPGCDALTIPHNSNISAGLMFLTASLRTSFSADTPVTVEEARRRQRWEPLIEVMQHKGDSECRVGAGTADELCNFELLPYDRFGPKFSSLARKRAPQASNFVRSGLKQGLRHQKELGVNPLKYGIVASTDTHIAAPGLTDESAQHPGHGGAGMGAGEGVPQGFPDDIEYNPGGLAVVWAEENTRDAIFSGMQRRETYGTSGTRPTVRLFGGWDYPDDLCESGSLVAQGYAKGVPMGSDLPERPAGAGAPRFAFWAVKDPGSVRTPGTPLQRIQIVKGWLDGDELRERTLDVAGGANDASVDLSTCEPAGRGAAQLCQVWEDPDFDPEQPAFYYGRVIENPTCRWSQHICVEARVSCEEPGSVPEALAACCSDAVPKTIQERAWTSPIWYTP